MSKLSAPLPPYPELAQCPPTLFFKFRVGAVTVRATVHDVLCALDTQLPHVSDGDLVHIATLSAHAALERAARSEGEA